MSGVGADQVREGTPQGSPSPTAPSDSAQPELQFALEAETWERIGRDVSQEWQSQTSSEFSLDAPSVYFDRGRSIVDRLAGLADGIGHPIGGGMALDFGCGPGKLARAIAPRFDLTIGVDVSTPMIEVARHFAGEDVRLRFTVNKHPDLRMFEDDTFSFVCSKDVLTHMRQPLMERYIAEFVRILKPGGLAVFQLHGEPTSRLLRIFPPAFLARAYNAVRKLKRRLVNRGSRLWEVNWMPRDRVESVLRGAGAEVLLVQSDPRAARGMTTWWYFAARPLPL